MSNQKRRKVDGSKWANQKGIACPNCGRRASHVYRVVNGNQQIKRERECVGCGERWETVETIKLAAEET